jgi:hypothetical protein
MSENSVEVPVGLQHTEPIAPPIQAKALENTKSAERPQLSREIRSRGQPELQTSIGKQVHNAFSRPDLQGEFNTESASWRSSISSPLNRSRRNSGNDYGRLTRQLSGLGLGAERGINASDFTGLKYPGSAQPSQKALGSVFLPGPAELTFSSASKPSTLPGSSICIRTAACPCSKHERIRNAKSI